MAPTYSAGLNFIAFFDLTPRACFLWASPSVEDCLGYTPEELIGHSGYDYIVADPSHQPAHAETILNDIVATQFTFRYRHKDGSTVPVLAISSICYEFLVACVFVLDSDGAPAKTRLMHSAAMTRIVQSKQEEFARIQRHHKAFRANSWSSQALEPEFRVCMILNRYSRTLGVLYASPSCEQVLHIDAEEVVGKPFLLFIRADDLGAFVEQVDVAKSSSAITHMRFWFQSPNWRQEIPCEAALNSASDGMVLVMRRCRPFVRRRLIGSVDLYERTSPISQPSSVESDSAQFMSTTSSTLDSTSPKPCMRETRSPTRRVLSANDINRITELIEDEDCKPILSVLEADRGNEDEPAVQVEDPRYFRQHVYLDHDDDMVEEEEYH
ncbi:hypothetical protein BGZ68_005814 [Mortierella alpina]|nr:hypothetical protein BGZ68_005814 [Mortierella alpina]